MLNYVILITHSSHLYSIWDFTHTCNPTLITKAKAASKALQFAAELGFNRVILEGDCQVSIKALKEDGIFLCTNILFIEDVHFDARHFNELRYSHVKREGNKVAHFLAQYALGILDFVV